MLFSKKSTGKALLCHNNRRLSSIKFVILSGAKDLLFAGQSPNHSSEEESEK